MIPFLIKNYKLIGAGLLVLLAVSTVTLSKKYSQAKGALTQCNLAHVEAEKKIKALTEAVAEAKSAGNVEFEVDPGTFRPGECPPCPKIKFAANFRSASAAGASGTAGVAENADNVSVLPFQPYTWAVALGGGGGMSVAGDTIWHGSAAVDYHNIRVYGAYGHDGSWQTGGQVILLKGNWP